MRRRPRLPAFFLVFTILATSCSSSYSGQKLGVDPKTTKEVVAEGVPYNLVRPEYTLSRTPPAAGAKDPTYALAVTYVPDPTQRYSLKIDPGSLKSPDFNMKFGSGGVLSSTTGTFTEQVTPFVTAIGSFAASVIGFLGVFDKVTFRQEFKLLLENSCIDLSDVERFEMTAGDTVGGELTKRILAFKDDDTFVAQFHYLTGKELACLKAELEEITKSKAATSKQNLKLWQDAKVVFFGKFGGEANFVDRLSLAVSTNDTDELVTIEAEVEALAENEAQLAEKKKEKQKLVTLAKLAGRATIDTRLQTALQAFVDVNAATWRARHLMFLEREMELVSLHALQRKLSSTDAENHLDRLRDERAKTMGTVELEKRAASLATFIESIREKSVDGGKAPATAEYAVARAELDAVNTAIAARRAAVLADAAPPAPAAITALANEALKVVEQAEIKASEAAGWIDGSGKKAPTYVLVLEEDK